MPQNVWMATIDGHHYHPPQIKKRGVEMNPAHAIERIERTAIIAVLRGDFPPASGRRMRGAARSRLDIVELTYNSRDWRDALPPCARRSRPDDGGMGTVLNPAQVWSRRRRRAVLSRPATTRLDQHSPRRRAADGPRSWHAQRSRQRRGPRRKAGQVLPGARWSALLQGHAQRAGSHPFCCNGNIHTGNIGDFLRGAVACGVAGRWVGAMAAAPGDIRAIANEIASIVRQVRDERAARP